MTVFKCKMCGGSIDVVNNKSVAECEYCGTKQTLPKMDDEKRINLYNRANHFRQQCAFDKAEQIYENIVAEMPNDAEAHWSLVLCRYGIEYVEDPSTFERVPTCHRTSEDSIFDDIDYIEAVNKADKIAVSLYQKEAAKIDRIQKEILEISQKEKPFDVFICYKETDSTGKRTLDSVKAQEIYDALTDKGYKVFFSRITLEDKLGQAYEPYIFAALNSAKVMLVIGTNPDHINAVWVKNEWSRYIKIMSKKKDRTLIPCYLDMSPYELPNEFSYLQGQDMSKIGFIQDLVKGIGKLIPQNGNIIQKTAVVPTFDNSSILSTAVLPNNKNCGKQSLEWKIDANPNWGFTFDDRYDDKTQEEYYADAEFDLCIAIITEDVDIAQLLLEHGADPNASQNNVRPLCHAISRENTDIIKLLLEYGADPNWVEDFTLNSGQRCKKPILSQAIDTAKIDIVQLLLKHGADPNLVDDTTFCDGTKIKQSMLTIAVNRAQNVDMVKLLLEHGADPNKSYRITTNGDHYSSLSDAIYNAKSVDMVKLLLEHGVDPNKSYRIYSDKCGQHQCSPLSDAIRYAKNVDMVKVLLEYGANPNLIEDITHDDGTKEKNSMLTYAIINAKNKDVVALLIKYGAKWNNIITYRNVITCKYITKSRKTFPIQ